MKEISVSMSEEKRKVTFTEKMRVWFKWFADGAADFLLKLGLTANTVTIIGCLGHIIAAYFAAKGKFWVAGLLLILFAVFDFIDGTMARKATGGTGTKFGAVLDSTTDRYAEFMIFGSILYYFAAHQQLIWVVISVAAMAGSALVPYTRAKGEIYGLDMRLGIMSRLERYIVLVLSLLIGWPQIAVAMVAVFGNITAIQRLLHMKKNLDK